MDRYSVPSQPSTENPKPRPRQRPWRRSELQLTGKFQPKYRHSLSDLLMHSYSEIGAFPHVYHVDGNPCQTHMDRIRDALYSGPQLPFRMQGISAVDFDNKVACTSVKSNELLIFDVGYISSKPVQVLRTRCTLPFCGSEVNSGLRDIAFTATDDSRLIASDTLGIVNIWDRRKSPLPCLELTGSHRTINTIQPHVENQANHLPVLSLKLASMLAKIGSLKAQSDIVPKEIHSIDLDPSCPYQLAFHLDDGW